MKISILRRKANITQSELAKLCDTTQQQIAKIENGAVDPKVSTIRRIARALAVDPGELFFSRDDFLQTIRSIVKSKKIETKGISPAHLSSICWQEEKLDPYHPFWEEIIVKNSKIFFKEEK